MLNTGVSKYQGKSVGRNALVFSGTATVCRWQHTTEHHRSTQYNTPQHARAVLTPLSTHHNNPSTWQPNLHVPGYYSIYNIMSRKLNDTDQTEWGSSLISPWGAPSELYLSYIIRTKRYTVIWMFYDIALSDKQFKRPKETRDFHATKYTYQSNVVHHLTTIDPPGKLELHFPIGCYWQHIRWW